MYKIKVLLPKICFHVAVVLSGGAMRPGSTRDMRRFTTEVSFVIKTKNVLKGLESSLSLGMLVLQSQFQWTWNKSYKKYEFDTKAVN